MLLTTFEAIYFFLVVSIYVLHVLNLVGIYDAKEIKLALEIISRKNTVVLEFPDSIESFLGISFREINDIR